LPEKPGNAAGFLVAENSNDARTPVETRENDGSAAALKKRIAARRIIYL
jgi:hypothetical protein